MAVRPTGAAGLDLEDLFRAHATPLLRLAVVLTGDRDARRGARAGGVRAAAPAGRPPALGAELAYLRRTVINLSPRPPPPPAGRAPPHRVDRAPGSARPPSATSCAATTSGASPTPCGRSPRASATASSCASTRTSPTPRSPSPRHHARLREDPPAPRPRHPGRPSGGPPMNEPPPPRRRPISSSAEPSRPRPRASTPPTICSSGSPLRPPGPGGPGVAAGRRIGCRGGRRGRGPARRR